VCVRRLYLQVRDAFVEGFEPQIARCLDARVPDFYKRKNY